MPTLKPEPRAQIVRLTPPDAEALHADIAQLAEMARRGEVTGLAFTALHPDGSMSPGLLGRARSDLHRAHTAAHRLVRAIMRLIK